MRDGRLSRHGGRAKRLWSTIGSRCGQSERAREIDRFSRCSVSRWQNGNAQGDSPVRVEPDDASRLTAWADVVPRYNDNRVTAMDNMLA